MTLAINMLIHQTDYKIRDERTIFYYLVTSPFAFCVITFEPIEVQTCSPPQNDRLNLSFVKNGRKLARNGQKMAILAGGWGWLTMVNNQLFSEGSLGLILCSKKKIL